MHHFAYRDGQLHCEDVPIERLARAVGTPFYLYSHATLRRHFEAFDAAFSGVDHLVCYSAKANAAGAILRLFAGMGGGLDIVSGGELHRGIAAGIPAERIVFSGVGKRTDEIDAALGAGIRMINAESVEELELIDGRAGALGRKAPVGIRVNPDVDPKTHPYISTGLRKNKFGIPEAQAMEAFRRAARLPHLEVLGVDCHIGSQITDPQPFADAMGHIAGMVRRLRREGIGISTVDVGGGLGITYRDEAPPGLDTYARAIVSAFEGMELTIVLEPGRVLVGNAGILVGRVLYRKPGPDKVFVVVDAGMNDLIRPSLYDAFHAVLPVAEDRSETLVRADVVGPICETGDFLARDRDVADLRPGDLLAVMSAGAYGFAMASNYCSRPRIAEVMVSGGDHHVIRRRERYEDLTAGESVPAFVQPRSSGGR